MRVLLSTYGSRGDVEPLAGLAVALKTLGAEAVVSTSGDDEFVELLARADVDYAPACMPIRQWIDDAKRAPMPLPKLAAKLIPLQYDAINAAADNCDAIVSTGLFPSAAAAQCVAEKRGLHYAHVAFCPLYLPSDHHRPFAQPGQPPLPEASDPRELWALNARHMHALFGDAVNAHRHEIGLPALDTVRDHVFTDHPLLASDQTLWPWAPTDLCNAVQTGAWILPDDRPLASDLLAFLDAGPPPIYVGFGSIALQSTRDAARAAIEAIRATGTRIILARGWADNARTDDGDDCLLIGEVNQQALFARVRAVVHHGGAGTTTTALHAGAPQLIVPQIVDQPYWAARVAGLGIGAAHDGASATLESLSAALKIALLPETSARARAAANAVSAGGAMAGAKVLLNAAERRQRTSAV